MHSRKSKFGLTALLAILILTACIASHAAVVVYLDEQESPYGYEHPYATDPESALTALASPPSPDFVGGNVLSSGVLPGTTVLNIAIVGDTTNVDFSIEIIGAGLEEARMSAIFGQVKGTLYQFGLTGNVSVLAAGQPLSSYIKSVKKVGLSPEALQRLTNPPIVSTVGLGGRMITVSPGHGKRWNGSYWATARPVYCSPLNEEDYHNDEMCAYLKVYMEQDSANVKMMRCVDKTFGNSPWASSTPWWQMGASYWLQQLGYPASVYGPGGTPLGQGGSDDTSEIQSRPLSSDYDGSDIYISLHTNGSVGDCAGLSCPTGTCTYYDAGTEHAAWGAVSQTLATNVNNAMVDAIRTKYSDSGWSNRGVLNSNGGFGEIRIPDRAAILIELAFHDSCDMDALKLRDNFFRSTTMWAVYKGTCDYFGVTPTWDYYSNEFVSHDIPAAMTVGERYTVHVTMRNRGVLWNDAKGFHLGAVGESDPFSTATRQTITGEVGPGSTYAFTYTLRAPLTVGTYTTDWQMVRDGYQWFGPTVSQTIDVTGTPDTEAPTVPADLAATPVHEMRCDLSWTASTDDRGVIGYNIYRNNVKIGTSATTAYSDGTCQPSITYTYEVSAYDDFANESGRSLPAQATTPAPSPPTTPLNLHGTASTTSTISMAWDASTDNIGVVGYRVYRNGGVVGTTAGATYTDTGLNYTTSYNYQVDAYDAVPSYSAKSTTVALSTQTPSFYTWTKTTSNADCYLRSGSPDATGNGAAIQTGLGGAGILSRRGLVRWDMTGAPTQAAIVNAANSARVKLYCYTRSSNQYRNIDLRKVNVNWTEGTATWNNMSANYSLVFATASVGPVADYTWSWNGYTAGLPEQNRGVQVYNQAEAEASMAKVFTDREQYGGANPTPRLEVDYYDIVAPTSCSISINSGAVYTTSETVTLTLSASDFPSGMSQMQFSHDGATYSTAEAYATSKSYALSGEGLKTVYVKFKDVSGNWSAPVSDTITLDTVHPTGTIEINGGAAYASSSPVTLTLSSTDSAQMQFNNENGEWSVLEAYGTSKSWPLSAGDGVKTVYVQFKDAAGNVSTEPISAGITLDTTGPSATAVTDEGAFTPSTTELKATISATDAESGIVAYQYCIGATAGNNDIADWAASTADVTKTGLTLSAGGSYYFSAKARNGAGTWSAPANSDGIKVVADTGSIADAKALDNAEEVALLGKALTANFGDCIYIQEQPLGNFGAIKVAKDGVSYTVGGYVDVAGLMNVAANGERVILSPTVKSGTGTMFPKSLLIVGRDLGGEPLNVYTPGIPAMLGVNNLGLLVNVYGKLTKSESGYWLVGDGGVFQYDPGIQGISVDVSKLSAGKKAELLDNDFVVMTGICIPDTVNSLLVPIVKLRGDADVTYYR